MRQQYVKVFCLRCSRNRCSEWDQLPPCCFPHLARLLYASCFNTRSSLSQAPGPGWSFKSWGGDEHFNFSCTNPPCIGTEGQKNLANPLRQERQKHSKEAWFAKRNFSPLPVLVPSPVAETSAVLEAAATVQQKEK